MSQAQSPLALEVHFAKLHDPRRAHLRRHLLIDILILTICATICGANDCQQIAAFGRRREDWLRKFLKLENGIPSHDTIERVLDLLKPDAFQSCFRSWVKTLQTDEDLPHIAIDGKTVRGSARGSQKALHVVSAFATANGVSLGQVAVDEKSNEIPAIPELLQVLELKGALVTLDAMGCQKEIAAKIVEGGGDYVLTVKDNQPKLKESIETYFEKAQELDYEGMTHSVHETEEKGHGREEVRRVEVILNPKGFDSSDWPELKAIGMCYRERVEKGQRSQEVVCFIGSRKAGAKVYGQALRNHWSIENSLHWQLDVSFREDANRMSRRQGAANLAAVRKVALNLLRQNETKGSIASKRFEAALDPTLLEQILGLDGIPGKA